MAEVSIVYVHLGLNPSPTLNSFAAIAQSQLPDSKIFLITDYPDNWKHFPGKVVAYDKSLRTKEFRNFVNKNLELEDIAGGYWLFTLERLFALQVLGESIKNPIIHFESDVFPILSPDVLDILAVKIDGVAVPRLSRERGIASIMYAKSATELQKVLERFLVMLNSNIKVTGDMDLLGLALNTGIVDELPTLPKNAWRIYRHGSARDIVFDGAALGQYLFGQDPIHTNDVRISGFQNSDFEVQLSKCLWRVDHKPVVGDELSFEIDGKTIYPVNLHIHSKEIIPILDFRNTRWIQAINEANRETSRISSETILNTIHTQPLKLSSRLRVARKHGFIQSGIRFLRKRFLGY